jgi:hypothetical protein
MEKTNWFEVYEYVDNDMTNGTRTIADFPTIEEAKQFVWEQQFNNSERKLLVDQWEMNEDGIGIAQRKF